jgi:DNA-binding NarL/FixJ family response regulator
VLGLPVVMIGTLTSRYLRHAACFARYRGACRAPEAALSCLIVDDKDFVLHAVSTLLDRDGITISGLASTTAEAIRHAKELRPDVAIVDVALGDESGFDLAGRLMKGSRRRPTVILTSTYSEDDIGHLIVAASADAFVPKTDLSGAVVREIHHRRGL